VTVQLLPSPIGDAISVSRRAARLAADPARAAALANARKWLSEQAPFKNGESLKKLRLGRGMSQSQLATAAKSTQANIARIESGHTDVQLSTIEKLAVALDLDPTRVFNAIRTSRAA